VAKLRADAITYIDGFDHKLWYDKPQITILNGTTLCGGSGAPVETIDAFNQKNGLAVHATAEEVMELLL
jgi:hypothetical protein